jgi:hypothetical protein
VIVTFRSPASGDVIMFGDVAHRLMQVMGKDATPEGIITVEQLPDAIARLRAAMEADKAMRKGVADEDGPASEAAPGGGERPYVSLAQRAAPLIELLEWSLKKKKPATWG